MSTTGSSTLPSGLSSTHGTGSSLTAMSLAMSSDSIAKKLRKTVAASSSIDSSAPVRWLASRCRGDHTTSTARCVGWEAKEMASATALA